MPQYYQDHHHTSPRALRPAFSPQTYGSVVGTVETSTEHEIVGHSGEHLQFYVDVNVGVRYQVDVNIQSSDGTPIGVYVATEALDAGGNPNQPFGPPAYGVFSNASLSYAGLGLNDGQFQAMSAARIQSLLESNLNSAEFVAIYGMTFDDGGASGKGIHETHYDQGHPNQDGALAIYSLDAQNKPQRTWFFFKFQNDSIG
jgi:hypothetical protein